MLEEPNLEKQILTIRCLFAAFELISGTGHIRTCPRRILMGKELEKYVEIVTFTEINIRRAQVKVGLRLERRYFQR